MKKLIIGTILCLISTGAYSKEVVIVKDKKDLYAVLTTCKPTKQKPLTVRLNGIDVGEHIIVKSRGNRLQKCEVKKVVKIT